MKADLGTFPWRTSVQDACDWKEAFEKEIREILANLRKEVDSLQNCKSEALARGEGLRAEGFERWIYHDEGRIFSLRQVLGELPKNSACFDNNKTKGDSK